MNKAQAIAYGKRNGAKYYVKNSLGGLYGGTKTYEQAVSTRLRQKPTASGKRSRSCSTCRVQRATGNGGLFHRSRNSRSACRIIERA